MSETHQKIPFQKHFKVPIDGSWELFRISWAGLERCWVVNGWYMSILYGFRTGWWRVWSCLIPSVIISGSQTLPSFYSSTRRICLKRRSRSPHSPSASLSLQVRFIANICMCQYVLTYSQYFWSFVTIPRKCYFSDRGKISFKKPFVTTLKNWKLCFKWSYILEKNVDDLIFWRKLLVAE